MVTWKLRSRKGDFASAIIMHLEGKPLCPPISRMAIELARAMACWGLCLARGHNRVHVSQTCLLRAITHGSCHVSPRLGAGKPCGSTCRRELQVPEQHVHLLASPSGPETGFMFRTQKTDYRNSLLQQIWRFSPVCYRLVTHSPRRTIKRPRTKLLVATSTNKK